MNAFVSIVIVLRNRATIAKEILYKIWTSVNELAADYEIIVIDNGSIDGTIEILSQLTNPAGLTNIQVFSLTREVDFDVATCVGLENALGDFVVTIDPFLDDIAFLPEMLNKAAGGVDVVFADNQQKPRQSFPYRIAYASFNLLYKSFNGIHLAKEAPQYRLLSKRVVNFILQHPQPAITYRHLPATGGFPRINIEYTAPPIAGNTKKLGESIDRGMRLLISTTQAPMRLVTSLSLFGAVANLIYSVYVVAVGVFKTDVAPGWVSMSLQQSGMFFLISLVLLVLGEYILHMASLSNDGPLYHVGQEFMSVRMTRREKLNIEDVSTPATRDLPNSDQVVA